MSLTSWGGRKSDSHLHLLAITEKIVQMLFEKPWNSVKYPETWAVLLWQQTIKPSQTMFLRSILCQIPSLFKCSNLNGIKLQNIRFFFCSDRK